jgi:hypothetical protein
LVYRDAAIFEAPHTSAPLMLVVKGVLTFILIEVIVEGRSDGVNEGDMFNLIRFEASKIEGGDGLAMGSLEAIVTCDE